jgi:hypothetical protein
MKIIWVVGCPRSGTSFLTEIIGKKTDYCFNEPWTKYPLGDHKNWRLPSEGDIVFKYCANCFHYKEIKAIYPNSKWIHIIRNPIHVIYSMTFPKKDSFPQRLWEEMGKEERRVIEAFKKWKKFIDCCSKIKEAKVVKYENIDLKSLSSYIGLDLDEPNFTNRNKIFDYEKMTYLKKIFKKNKINIKKIY